MVWSTQHITAYLTSFDAGRGCWCYGAVGLAADGEGDAGTDVAVDGGGGDADGFDSGDGDGGGDGAVISTVAFCSGELSASFLFF